MAEYGTPALSQTPPTARYVHGDRTIDYTPSADVAYGQVVVLGNMVGVALVPIKANTKGALQIEGSFDFPKASGDGGMAVGTLAYWDATNSVATSTSTGNTYIGKVELTAEDTATTVRIQMESVANGASTGFGEIPVATVAVGGNTISNANAVGVGYTRVTGADNSGAVRLPTPSAGKQCLLKNASTTSVLKVFPAAGTQINANGTNAVYNMAAASTRLFIAYNSTLWETAPETIA